MFFSSLAFGAEPENLNNHKQTLIEYYKSGQYEKDIEAVIHQAHTYLKEHLTCRKSQSTVSNKKLAIVLDIDDTALSNYKDLHSLNFGGNHDLWDEFAHKADAPAISHTLKLYQFARANGIAVIFITGRREGKVLRTATIKNLKKAGYNHWDKLILKPIAFHQKPTALYKASMRKQLSENEGYNIILNIGDQKSDLTGGYAQKSFKLPNPYYYIP